jgi:predicted S18 family serine protease
MIMEGGARGSRIRIALLLSMVINLLLAVYAGYTIGQSSRLREQIDDLSGSYSDLVESARSLEQRLNVTLTQLDYYKGLAEYYSNLTTSGNATAGVIGHTTIPIVALETIRRGFRAEYRGVVMKAEVELREGSGRVLVDTVPKIGIDIQASVRAAVLVAESVTGVSLSKTDVILTITAGQEVEIVDGASAGAAITTALLATIRREGIDQEVCMTGTINSDGSIGAVGGVPEKALAAANAGSKSFYVPKGQGTVVVYVPKTSSPFPGWTITTYEQKVMKLQDYLEEQGYSVTVEEVGTIEEAYGKFSTT